MRGWIYVISNKSMPGLVKVGYSTKDPEERAKELDQTGTPHPYVVEYDILIEGDLYQVEQQTHRNLSHYLEGKEWFRCTPEQAVMAIRQVAKEITITESFKKAEREKAEILERERELERATQQEKREREAELRNIKAEIIDKEREMIKKYEDLFKESSLAERKVDKQKIWDEYHLLILKAKKKANASYNQGKIFEAQGSYWEALIHYKIAVNTFSNVSARISELKLRIQERESRKE